MLKLDCLGFTRTKLLKTFTHASDIVSLDDQGQLQGEKDVRIVQSIKNIVSDWSFYNVVGAAAVVATLIGFGVLVAPALESGQEITTETTTTHRSETPTTTEPESPTTATQTPTTTAVTQPSSLTTPRTDSQIDDKEADTPNQSEVCEATITDPPNGSLVDLQSGTDTTFFNVAWNVNCGESGQEPSYALLEVQNDTKTTYVQFDKKKLGDQWSSRVYVVEPKSGFHYKVRVVVTEAPIAEPPPGESLIWTDIADDVGLRFETEPILVEIR